MHNRTRRTNRFLLAALVTGFAAVAAPSSGQVINENLKLLPNDGAAGDWFGFSIAIDSGVVAVGASRDDDNGSNSGSAYLLNASTGSQITKLLATDGTFDDEFGWSIAIDGGVVAVGSPRDDARGSAYLFDASTGVQIAKLVASGGPRDQDFGITIAIDNGIVAVGAPYSAGDTSGSAFLFDASTGAQIAILLPDDGEDGDQFGASVAIDNGVVAIGSRLDDDNGHFSGSAYLFNASTGAQIAKLLPSDGAAEDQFGWAIAIDNGIVAVGVYLDDDNGPDSGSAYLFDASTGAQIAKLLPSDGAAEDRFGFSIGIDNGFVVVGSPLDDDNGDLSGSAYLFDVASGDQIAKLLPSDGAATDLFGRSIAIHNGVIAVGAAGDDDNGSSAGSAYVFDVGAQCPADLDGDGQGDLDDLAFLVGCMSGPGQSYESGCEAADIDGDGDVDMTDFAMFQAAFGCP